VWSKGERGEEEEEEEKNWLSLSLSAFTS